MSQVKWSSGLKGAAAVLFAAAVVIGGTAGLTALRTTLWGWEHRASALDREIDALSEQLRDAERTLTALTAPMGMYTKAEEQLGLQRAALSGVVRLDMPVDAGVMSAALPGTAAN